MITPEEYYKIQAIKRSLSNNARAPRLTDHPDFPLRRFVRCECGSLYTASWSRGRSKKYAMYHCHNKKCAHVGRSVSRETLEAKFCELLKKTSPSAEFLSLFRQIVRDRHQNHQAAKLQEKARYERELKKLETRRSTLLEMRVNQEVSKEEFREMKEAWDCQMAALNAGQIQGAEFDLETAVAGVTEFISDLADRWTTIKPACQRRLLRVTWPEGITYHMPNCTFGTAILSPIFGLNSRFLSNPSVLVAELGQSWHQILLDIKKFHAIATGNDGLFTELESTDYSRN